MTPADKVRENRCRRMLERRDHALLKSRTRDPGATSYGGYMIAKLAGYPRTKQVVAGQGWTLSLADVEQWLAEHDRAQAASNAARWRPVLAAEG